MTFKFLPLFPFGHFLSSNQVQICVHFCTSPFRNCSSSDLVFSLDWPSCHLTGPSGTAVQQEWETLIGLSSTSATLKLVYLYASVWSCELAPVTVVMLREMWTLIQEELECGPVWRGLTQTHFAADGLFWWFFFWIFCAAWRLPCCFNGSITPFENTLHWIL